MEQVKLRGMNNAKDARGIDQFPYARSIFEDYYNPINAGDVKIPPSMLNPRGPQSLNMVRETPEFAAEFLTENIKKKIPEQKIDTIIKGGKANNDSASKINKSVLETANREKIPHPERAFDNPKVEYVDTQTISNLIPRGNMIKYNVGKFQREGGQYYDPMSTDIEEFAKSGKETLRESIYNEGFKEPIVIGVSKETGEVLLNEGHHRLHAALQMGISRVPVVFKIKGRLNFSEFQSPALINTKGLPEYEDMSFSELDFESRLKRPKASSNQGQDEFGNRTSNYYYMNEPFRQDMPRTDENNFPPMREGYYRKTEDFADGGAVMPKLNVLEINKRMQLREEKMIAEGNSASEIDAMKAELRKELYKAQGLPSDIEDFYADGGEVMNGIGSLNETARNMSRGPRGIAGYQQFAGGGEGVRPRSRPPEMQEMAEIRAYLGSLSDDRPRSRPEKYFEINSYDINGETQDAIDFKDGMRMFMPDVERMITSRGMASEPLVGRETGQEVLEFLQENNPTSEEFIDYFSSARLAEGGEALGPPPLRGPDPQGIGAYQQFSAANR
jgi:hypothetical protein